MARPGPTRTVPEQAAGVTIAESLVRLALTTSKVRTYAAPRSKRISGFPVDGWRDRNREAS